MLSLIPEGHTTIIVEELRMGQKKLAMKSIYKTPETDLEKVARTLRAIRNRSVVQTAKTDASQPSVKNLTHVRRAVNL